MVVMVVTEWWSLLVGVSNLSSFYGSVGGGGIDGAVIFSEITRKKNQIRCHHIEQFK